MKRTENRLTAVFQTLVDCELVSQEELAAVVESVDRGQKNDPDVPVAGYILRADESEIAPNRKLADRVLAGLYTPDSELPWA